MAFFPPSPRAVIQMSRNVVGQVLESAAAVATVPVRVFGLLSQAELLASRITLVADRAESLVDRVGVVVQEAEDTVGRTSAVVSAAAVAVQEAATVATGAAVVMSRVGETAQEAGELLEGYAPTLREAAPLAARFVRELTAEEVTAAIRLIDELPRLRTHLSNDVMPLLGKLDQVGPDMHSLLEVTRDLHLAISGIPGLRMLRRRGERLDDDEAGGDDR